MNYSKVFFIAVLTISLSSCQTPEKEPGLLLAESNNMPNQQLLLNAMSEMLNGSKITLADNAFTTSNEVIIEKYSGDQNNQLGRDYRKPDHFRLWVQGEGCILEHVESGASKSLPDLVCIAESK